MEPEQESSKKSPLFWIIMVVIVIIGVGVAYTLLTKNSDEPVVDNSTAPTSDNSVAETVPDTDTDVPPATETETPAEPKTVNVSYTDNCYDPESITINKGDTVVFTNNSSGDMWPASDNHPTHTIYPEFDANQSIPSGQTYSFTFDKTGTWQFHNHEKSSCEGTIIVN